MNKRAGNLMNGARENYWKKKDAEIAEEYLKKVYKRMSIFFPNQSIFQISKLTTELEERKNAIAETFAVISEVIDITNAVTAVLEKIGELYGTGGMKELEKEKKQVQINFLLFQQKISRLYGLRKDYKSIRSNRLRSNRNSDKWSKNPVQIQYII